MLFLALLDTPTIRLLAGLGLGQNGLTPGLLKNCGLPSCAIGLEQKSTGSKVV